MKKLLIIITLTFALTSIYAQSNLGIRGGVNFSTQSFDGVEDVETGSLAGWQLGLNYEIAASESFAVRPGVEYAVKGGRLSIDDAGDLLETENKFHYLYVPIDLVFDLSIVDIFAGPYFQYALSGSSTTGDVNVDLDFDQNDVNRTDYGLNVGANVDIGDKIYVGGYYSLGMGNLSNEVDLDIKNSSLNLFLTYRL